MQERHPYSLSCVHSAIITVEILRRLSKMWLQLTYGISVPPHTSMVVNETEIYERHAYRLVDVPGHPRIRAQFSEYINKAKAIVFVVDSSTITRNGPAVAEFVSF